MKTETPPFDPTQDTAAAPLANPAPAGLMWAAADLARASIADNTRRAYKAALRQFEQSAFPEADAGVAGLPHAAVSTGALCGLRRHGGLGAAATRVLAGFRRLAAGRGRGMVAGVRWEQADRAAEMAEGSGNLRGLRDAAIVAVASDALLRVSEIAALDVADVDLTEQTVLIRRSKTDQEGQGVVQFLGKSTAERVRAWLLSAGLTDGALFRAVKSGQAEDGRLTDRSIRRIITQRARATRVGGRVSGHSLRVGSAQSLATAGASLVEMQVAGRW